jgi:hypothetical protein
VPDCPFTDGSITEYVNPVTLISDAGKPPAHRDDVPNAFHTIARWTETATKIASFTRTAWACVMAWTDNPQERREGRA